MGRFYTEFDAPLGGFSGEDGGELELGEEGLGADVRRGVAELDGPVVVEGGDAAVLDLEDEGGSIEPGFFEEEFVAHFLDGLDGAGFTFFAEGEFF